MAENLKEEGDLLLDFKEKEKVINLLKKVKFEEIKVHPHYYKYNNPKLGPRHNVSLEKAKEIYSQFDKIIAVSKRKGLHGYKYNLVYRINKKTSFRLMFFLDESPIKIFNAIKEGKNVEKRLIKKFLGFSK